jgi:hypothetical protein
MLGRGDQKRLLKLELRKAKQAHEALASRKEHLQRELIAARTTLRGFDRRLRVAGIVHEIKALSPDLRTASARMHALTIDLERMAQ